MPLISKEVILALVVLYLFSNSKQKYNLFFVLLRAYQLSDSFISYINSVLTPEHFTFDKIENDATCNSSDNHNTEPDNSNTDIKYENKYLEEIKKLNKEFIFDADEEAIKLEKYMEFITSLKENKLEIHVNKLNVIKEKLTKFEKGEDTRYLSDSEKDYCISNIKEEDIEEQINILLKENAVVQIECDKLNAYLESDEGKEQIMKDALDLATKFVIHKKLEKLENCYVMDKTPLGNVLMIFNIDKNTFSYYSDNTIPYRYLETVGRKYVKTFACRPVFIDMEEELEKAEERWELERAEKEKKEEETRQKIEELKAQNKTVEQKKSVFAKFKSYNKDSSATKAMVAHPKNSIPNKKLTAEQENEKMLLKDNANRYTYQGKLSNFNFLKKTEKKTVDKKYAMTFADFKKLQNNKKE
jgi:hypothetical protein